MHYISQGSRVLDAHCAAVGQDPREITRSTKTILQGVKRVDVEALYDDMRYCPLVRQVDGKPMFLYRAG